MSPQAYRDTLVAGLEKYKILSSQYPGVKGWKNRAQSYQARIDALRGSTKVMGRRTKF
jgi:hypothetical protein